MGKSGNGAAWFAKMSVKNLGYYISLGIVEMLEVEL